MKNVLREIEHNVNKKICEIDILDEEERHKLLHEFNDTYTEYPRDKTIHELFEEQVERTPDNIAVVYESQQLTYRELNERANQLARVLREKGVVPDSIVGIMVERSIEMIIGIIGILKAGGAYLPIDPEYPVDRIRYMLEDSSPKLMLTEKQLINNTAYDVKVVELDNEKSYAIDGSNLEPINSSNDLAYIIYTSGSTGEPKGVMIEHRNVINFIKGIGAKIEFESTNRILGVTTICFDIFGLETLLPLTLGAGIMLSNKDQQRDVELLSKFIIEKEVNVLQLTPSRLQLLNEYKNNRSSLKQVRSIIIGGEALSQTLYKRTVKVIGDAATIYNVYGPTETTIWSTVAKIETDRDITIGKPISNTKIYIIDKYMNLQPVGVAGELCIGGEGLARGYLKRPELTAEKFVENPFIPGERMYSTGDMARWLPDGNIEFLGSMDYQVKIRGYRIELGEIESRLLKHEAVKGAVVVAKEENGNKYLCAYIETDKELTVSELRGHLGKELPDYMIPSYFVQLDKMPLTPNGKVDRKALPEPDGSIMNSTEYEAPSNEIEEKLVKIWQEVLKAEKIGTNDNFFDIGGHSLKATSMVSKIHKELNIEVPLREVFKTPTIKGLAEYIKGQEKNIYSGIEPVEEREYYELSSAQKRLYTLQQFDLESTSYNMPGVLEIEGKLDVEKLENAFKKLIERHEALKTSFELIGEEVVQKIHKEVEFAVEHKEAREEDVEEILRGFIRPFDLSKAPLLRVGLVKLQQEKSILMFDMHHIISDGTSMGILTDEFVKLYEGKELSPLRLQCKDYAAWQNSMLKSKMMKQEEYWLITFEGEIPVLSLPTDYQRPAIQNFEGDRIYFELNQKVTEGLRKIAKETGTTMYMVLLASFNILLYKYSGQEDIVVGSPIAGRPHADLENIIGMFVNTLAMRNYPSGEKTYRKFLREVKENALEAYENQDYQFEELVDKLNVPRDMSRNAVFDVMFALQNTEMGELSLEGITIKPYKSDNRISKFDMTLAAVEGKDSIGLSIEYCTKLFKKDTAERMYRHLENIILAVADNPDRKLGEIEILTEEERKQILVDFNNTKTEYPKDKTIHQLFEAQVEKTPDNIAIVYEDKQLTYRELNERANQLARALRDRGVEPDSIVGIMVERSLEMIVGIMGILKAGGAYLPIDPEYPKDRIEYMLEDSGANILLMQNHIKEKIIFNGTKILINSDIYIGDTHNLNHINKSNHLAYVIYTSGSTGKPKGNLTMHYNITRVVTETNYIDISESDTILQLSNYAFDGSVFDIYGALLNGAKLILFNKEFVLDTNRLSLLIEKQGVSVFFVTTALFNTLLDTNIESLKYIRKVLFGGERVSVIHAKKALEYLGEDRIIHVYGPTEGTVFATYYNINSIEENVNTVPIGAPISNTKIYIVDKNNSLCSIGVVGELCISGDGLARGYLNRPELTAEKFIEDPFESGERMYRTGDRARWLPDGNIEFLGRIDHQVKIRGFRIELEEIESWLLKHEAVKEAVVIAKEEQSGDKYLCAYITTDKELTVSDIKGYLGQELPEYMIPSYFVQLDKLPLTPNGKLDRKGLPDPEVIRNTDIDYKAPRNEIDEKLVKIWQEVLGVEKIGINDNFFELGGHSLKATSMVSKIYKELNVEVPLREVFKTPAIKGISEYIAISKHSKYKAIEVADERDYYPVSSAQNRLWILKQANDNDTGYNMTQIISIEGKLNREMVEAAFKKLIERHEILKTSFEYINAMPVQKVNKDAKLDISYTEAKEGIDGIITSFIKPFDLRKAPLLRALLIQIEKDKHIMAFDMHHIISDGLSMNIITKEFAELYQGRELPEQRIQYKDYCIWHNYLLESGILRGQEEYWKKKLDNFIYTELPKKDTTFQGKAKGARKELKLDKETTARIEKYCKEANITQFTFMLSIFKLIISKYSGQNDITVGIPVAGRNYADLDNMIGLFLNVLIIRTVIKTDLSFGEYLNMVEENILEAQDNQDYPYEKLYAHLKETINFNRPSIFSILFNYMPYQNVSYDFGDIAIKPYEIDAISPKYDITLYLRESDEISMSLVYKDNLYDGFLIKSILDNYSTLINILLDNDNMSIRQINSECGSAIEEDASSWDEYLDNNDLI